MLWPSAYTKLTGAPDNAPAYFWTESPDGVSSVKAFLKAQHTTLFGDIAFLFGLTLPLTARASKATWVLNNGQRRLFARDHINHKVTKKPNGTTFTRPTNSNFELHSRTPGDKKWAHSTVNWMKVMIQDKEYDLKSARFDRVNNAFIRKDASAPDWAKGQQMPIVCQWYNKKGDVDVDNPPSPHGVEVDVSQCNTFTQKQYLLYIAPPPEALAAEKAASSGKGKPSKGKSTKGKLGTRSPPRMMDLVQRSSILGSLQYWNEL